MTIGVGMPIFREEYCHGCIDGYHKKMFAYAHIYLST